MVDTLGSDPTKSLFSVNYADMAGFDGVTEGYSAGIDMWAESQAAAGPLLSTAPSGTDSQPSPGGADQPRMHNTQNILNNNLNITNVRVDPNKHSNGTFAAKQDGLNGLKATVEGAKREMAEFQNAAKGPGGPEGPKGGTGIVASTARDGALALAADVVLPGAGTVVAAVSAVTTLGRGAGSFITAMGGGGSSFASAVDKGKSTPGYTASSGGTSMETQTVSQGFANQFLNTGPGFGTTFSSALKDIKGIDMQGADAMVRAVENLDLAVKGASRDMDSYSNRQFSVLDKDVAEAVITSELDPSMAIRTGAVSGPMV